MFKSITHQFYQFTLITLAEVNFKKNPNRYFSCIVILFSFTLLCFLIFIFTHCNSKNNIITECHTQRNWKRKLELNQKRVSPRDSLCYKKKRSKYQPLYQNQKSLWLFVKRSYLGCMVRTFFFNNKFILCHDLK